jgi:hypothetical protein
MVPLALWRMRADPDNLNGEKKRLDMPVSAILGAVAGIWLAPFGLLLFLPLWGMCIAVYRLAVGRFSRWPQQSHTVPFVMALMLLVLNPEWTSIAKHTFSRAISL